MRNLAILLAISACSLTTTAQKSTTRKFGKVTPEELQTKVYALDSNASAVILYDYGQSIIEGNSKGFFSLNYKQHRIVHILKKSGYDIGDVEIPLYVQGQDEERIDGLKAVTYNLQDGKLVETKMEKSAVFTDKQDKNHILKKFTLPNIKEGSIIEYEYSVVSDFLFNLKPWAFQGSAPRLWSEYQLSVPDFLGYIFLSQGYLPFHINERKDRRTQFHISDSRGTGASESGSINSNVTDYRWVIKDVPELKEEGFTSA